MKRYLLVMLWTVVGVIFVIAVLVIPIVIASLLRDRGRRSGPSDLRRADELEARGTASPSELKNQMSRGVTDIFDEAGPGNF